MFHRHKWKTIHQRQYPTELYARRPFIPSNPISQQEVLTIVQECETCGKIRERTTRA